jgi:hypothetical protein
VIPRQSRMFLWAGLQILVGWLLLAFLHQGAWGMTSLGLLFGVMFGHTTLAATWAALGPLPMLWRIPLSLGWVALIVAGTAVNLSVYGGSLDTPLVIAVVLFGQWLLLQTPLWGLVLLYGLKLKHQGNEVQERASLQFGIRQLMIFTAMVATLLAIGRAMVALLSSSENSTGDIGLVVLACATVVMTLPLVLAALLPRWSVAAVMLVCSIMAVATIGEANLINSMDDAVEVGYELFSINAFTYACIVTFAATVRLSGYQLNTGKAPSESPATV